MPIEIPKRACAQICSHALKTVIAILLNLLCRVVFSAEPSVDLERAMSTRTTSQTARCSARKVILCFQTASNAMESTWCALYFHFLLIFSYISIRPSPSTTTGKLKAWAEESQPSRVANFPCFIRCSFDASLFSKAQQRVTNNKQNYASGARVR